MSDQGEKTCPLCAEEMDLTDQQLKPCKCGYQICVWCWHHIMDMAEKSVSEGRCPACRTPYDKEKIVGMTVNCERLASDSNMERKRTQKSKSKPSEGRKQLNSVRVIQRNLVYVVGLPLNLADEDLLQCREYFGQYGKVSKVSMTRAPSGAIQQFPNNTCSVYITYCKEEEAVRCIQSVHGFILDSKPLKACFGTTKYCHAWLRGIPCNNPDCLYLHEIGSEEDSFTKDEIISACTRTRVQQITGATNYQQRRSGSMLPPPWDDYASDSSTPKPILKVPSNMASNAASVHKSSPPNGSYGRSSALPAAASWGTRVPNKQISMLENGTLASASVANTAHRSVSCSDIIQKPSHRGDDTPGGVSKALQEITLGDSGSERTDSPDSHRTSNCSIESSHGSRGLDEPDVMSSLDHAKETDEGNVIVNSFPSDAIRQPANEVSKEDCAMKADERAVMSQNDEISDWETSFDLPCSARFVQGPDHLATTSSSPTDILNGFSERSKVSLEPYQGKNKTKNSGDDIIASILDLDFDPWDESLTSPQDLVKLLGESDQQRASYLMSPNLLRPQHNNQSRFSFARHDESNNHELSSNYSQGLDTFASNHLFSSHKPPPVSKSQISAPPGFSAPSRSPPGFSSLERIDPTSNSLSGARWRDPATSTSASLWNTYQAPPAIGNSSFVGEIEFMDPAILAVGRGRVHDELDIPGLNFRSDHLSQFNTMERHENHRYHDRMGINSLSSNLNDPYGICSLPPSRQQASGNSLMHDGRWVMHNEVVVGQGGNDLGMGEFLRNGRLGLNDNLYYNGGFQDNRTYRQ